MNSVALCEYHRTSFRSLVRSFIWLHLIAHTLCRLESVTQDTKNLMKKGKMSHTIEWMLDATEIIAEYEIKDAKWEDEIVASSTENH